MDICRHVFHGNAFWTIPAQGLVISISWPMTLAISKVKFL
jgi:hypothetical protein